jgi:hypothetical protein
MFSLAALDKDSPGAASIAFYLGAASSLGRPLRSDE